MDSKARNIVSEYQKDLGARGLALDEEQEKLLIHRLEGEFSKKYTLEDPIDLVLLRREVRSKRGGAQISRVINGIKDVREGAGYDEKLPTNGEMIEFYKKYCDPRTKSCRAWKIGTMGVILIEDYLERTGNLPQKSL